MQKIKKECKYKKVGHAGTLDPLAEGVLIVLTDADTKRQTEFMDMAKEYRVTIAFGYESDSHDLGTSVRAVGKEVADGLTLDLLNKTTAKYIGKISQQVPAYSAAHINGQRSYTLARQKKRIELPYKDVEIYDIKVCSFEKDEAMEYPITMEVLVSCGKGTYIRSLVRDIGKDLKCGVVVTSLIRTKVGRYTINDGSNLESLF